AGDAVRAGAEILYDTRVLRIEDASLRDPAAGSGEITLGTSKGPVTARVAVNAAGLYADTLAGALAPDMRVIPFRGYYAELAPARGARAECRFARAHVLAAVGGTPGGVGGQEARPLTAGAPTRRENRSHLRSGLISGVP